MLKWIILCFIVFGASGAPTEQDHRCENCQLFVGEVRDLVQVQLTQGQIINYFKEICQKLPSDQKDVCYFFLQDHSKELFDRLASHLSPHEICQKLPTNVCKPPVIEPVEEPADEPVQEPVQESVEVTADEPDQEPAEENVQDLKCEVCKLVIESVEKYVENNKSIAAINSTLWKFCKQLPGDLGDLCKQFEPELIKAIQDGVDPGVACQDLKLCTGGNSDGSLPCDVCYNAAEVIEIKDAEALCSKFRSCQKEAEAMEQELKAEEAEPREEETEEPRGIIECELCKFLIQAVDKLLVNNKTVDAINSTLQKVCQSLPGNLGDLCKKYEPNLIEALKKAISGGDLPDVACKAVKLCAADTAPYVDQATIACDTCQATMEAVAGERGVGVCFDVPGVCIMPGQLLEQEPEPPRMPVPVCEVCQFMVESVNDQLQGSSEEEVVKTFERVCSQMPQQEQQFCTKYGTAVIEHLMGGVNNPRQSCVQMTVCEPLDPEEPEQEEPVAMEMKQPGNVKDDPKCEICQLLMDVLFEIVKDNTTITKLNTTLFKFCDLLPTTLDLQKLADARCELCKFSVELLDKALKEGGPGLNNTLYGLCDKLPAGQWQEICRSLVPQIENFAKQGLNPTQACEAVNFCPKNGASAPLAEVCNNCMGILERAMPGQYNEEAADAVCSRICHNRHKRSLGQKKFYAGEVKKVMKKLTDDKNVAGFIECEMCKIVVRTVDDFVKQNKTAKSINDTVYTICLNLTGQQLVQKCLEAAPKLVQAIMNGVDPDKVCKTIGLCTEISIRKLVKRAIEDKETGSHNLKDAKCDLCKFAIKWLDAELSRNASKEEINKTVYQICESIPIAELKDLCLQYAPNITAVFVHGIDPLEACKKIGLCSEALGSPEEKKTKLKEIKKSEEKTDEPNDLKCTVCKTIVTLIDSELKKNSSHAAINATVYKFCNTLTGSIKLLCLGIAKDLVKDIEQGFNASVACQKLGLCPQQSEISKKEKLSELLITRQIQKDTAGQKNEKGELECSLCKAVCQEIDQILAKNASEKKINETVYGFCAKFPASLKSVCDQMAPRIVEEIVGGVDPDFICQKLTLCQKEAKKEVINLKQQPNDQLCDLCRVLVELADELLIPVNETDAQANKTLYDFCNSFPEAIKEGCDLVIPRLVKLIHDRKNTTKACEDIDICEPSYKAGISAELKSYIAQFKQQKSALMKNKKKTVKCDICMKVMQAVYDDLSDNYPKIRRAIINNVCNKLPEMYKIPCTKMSSAQLNGYWKQFLGNYRPSLMCEMAGCVGEYHLNYESNESRRT